MSTTTLIDAIEGMLTRSPKSARDFLRELKTNKTLSEADKKSAVNSALYKLLKEGKAEKTDSTPPLWTKPREVVFGVSSSEDGSDEEVTAIFIDVSNSPCQEQAIAYADVNMPMYITANHEFPAELPKSTSHARVVRLPEGVSVNTEIIVRATTFVSAMMTVGRPANVIIVSTSKAFRGFPELLKQSFASLELEVTVVSDGWEGLKIFLE